MRSIAVRRASKWPTDGAKQSSALSRSRIQSSAARRPGGSGYGDCLGGSLPTSHARYPVPKLTPTRHSRKAMQGICTNPDICIFLHGNSLRKAHAITAHLLNFRRCTASMRAGLPDLPNLGSSLKLRLLHARGAISDFGNSEVASKAQPPCARG